MELKARRRKVTGKKVKKLRKDGYLPATIYGNKFDPINLEVEYIPFQKVFRKVGKNNLVDLQIDEGEVMKVLVHEVQKDSLSDVLSHIDFYRVDMKKTVKANIPLEFKGESEAVKNLGAILVKNYDSIAVECLPADLVSNIQVDISSLKKFEDSISIKDLKLPTSFKVLSDIEETLVLVKPPRSEEEMAALEGKPEENVQAVGVVEKKEKKEEDTEGAATEKPETKKEK